MVGEREEVIEAVAAWRRRTGDGVDLLEVETALEDSQPMEQLLAVGVEQVVTPGDRALQRALTRRRVAERRCPARAGERRGDRGSGSARETDTRAAASSIPSGRSSSR